MWRRQWTLVAAMTLILGFPMMAEGRQWVQCGNTNPRQASCPDTVAGSSCTFTDANGVSRTGSVRICPPCTDTSGRDLSLSGAYCFVPGIAPPRLCPGGEIILHEEAVVGCLFKGSSAVREGHCEGSRIFQPIRPFGTCWVCIQPDRAGLVSERSAWQQLHLADAAGSAKAADFSCLGPATADHWAGEPVATRPSLVPQDFGDGTGGDCQGRWTAWLNRDNPGGSGDYETLKDHVQAGKVCPQPKEIECRTRAGVDWRQSGEVYHCDARRGGYCTHREQTEGRCSDYEVRFCC